ncbi:hypothetical protein ACQ4WY_01370 [Janthinobacterium sp. LB2P49]|uniref:hypothetical protein n=1 Tax=Janthinobacterium sp. LB2P49 TaxID=3424198 RepID=UPI003F1ED555
MTKVAFKARTWADVACLMNATWRDTGMMDAAGRKAPRSFNLWARWLSKKLGCDMAYSFSRLIIATSLACLVMGMAAIQQMRLGRPIGKVKYFLLKLAVLIWLVSGLFVGTLYSHGVDVAWYIFGVAVSLAGCVVAGIVVFAWQVCTRRKHDS